MQGSLYQAISFKKLWNSTLFTFSQCATPHKLVFFHNCNIYHPSIIEGMLIIIFVVCFLFVDIWFIVVSQSCSYLSLVLNIAFWSMYLHTHLSYAYFSCTYCPKVILLVPHVWCWSKSSPWARSSHFLYLTYYGPCNLVGHTCACICAEVNSAQVPSGGKQK